MKRYQIITLLAVVAVLAMVIVIWNPFSNQAKNRPTVEQLARTRSFVPPSQRIAPSQPGNLTTLYQAPHSDRMGYFLGTLGDGSYSTRSATLRLFDNYLSKADVATLESFLTDPNNLSKLSPQEQAALKNEVMNLLSNQLQPPTELASTLINIFESDKQSDVIRDYAVQHLGGWYHDGASAEEQPRIWAVFEQAAQGHTGSIPGTSLLAMLQLDDLNPSQQKDLHQMALEQIQFPGTDGMTMATSLQVCSRLQIQDAYPVALRLANTDQTAIPVRASAIATVGDLGTAADVTQLESWINGDQPRLRLPASAALNRLRKRLHL